MGIFFECMHRETMKFMWRIGRNNQEIWNIQRILYDFQGDQTLIPFEKLPTPHKL